MLRDIIFLTLIWVSMGITHDGKCTKSGASVVPEALECAPIEVDECREPAADECVIIIEETKRICYKVGEKYEGKIYGITSIPDKTCMEVVAQKKCKNIYGIATRTESKYCIDTDSACFDMTAATTSIKAQTSQTDATCLEIVSDTHCVHPTTNIAIQYNDDAASTEICWSSTSSKNKCSLLATYDGVARVKGTGICEKEVEGADSIWINCAVWDTTNTLCLLCEDEFLLNSKDAPTKCISTSSINTDADSKSFGSIRFTFSLSFTALILFANLL